MKIKNIIYKASVLTLMAGITTACVHDFEEINVNPNTMLVGELNPYGVFEATFYGFGKRHIQYNYTYNNEIAQFTVCSSTTNQIHRYNITNSQFDGIWSAYAQAGANAVHMIQQADKFEEPAAKAVGLTLKVLFLSTATDLFGDIPYSEAFKGTEGITAPKFDSQEEVYRQMFDELEAANDIYKSSPVFAKPTIDLMYGGDMAKWRKFNNSLYLRLLMRVSGRPEIGADAKIAAIVSNPSKYPVITSNAENATIHNTGIDPYYAQYRPTTMTTSSFSTHYLTNTLVNLCVQTGVHTEIDPRLPTYAQMSKTENDWIGVQGGATLDELREDVDGASSLNYAVLVRDDAPVWILEYSEVQFILAEAALKGFINGGDSAARSYYENAVRASCQKWSELSGYSITTPIYPITESRINAFLNGNMAGWEQAGTSVDDKMKLIATQKFLSLFWNGFEAFNEVRRTGYPVMTIGNGCSYNNYEFPQRLVYPTNTVGSNSANVQEALDRMGGVNDMRTAVWWSYKAINGTFTAVRAPQRN